MWLDEWYMDEENYKIKFMTEMKLEKLTFSYFPLLHFRNIEKSICNWNNWEGGDCTTEPEKLVLKISIS